MSEGNQDQMEDTIKEEKPEDGWDEPLQSTIITKEMSPKQRREIIDVIKEERIRELANEIDDGALDTYIEENYADLCKDFIQNDLYNDEFRAFCKEQYEVNQ